MLIDFKKGRLLGVAVFALPDETEGEPAASEAVDHRVKIKPDPNAPGRCTCVDRDAGGAKTKAPRGHWVVWENDAHKNVRLRFDMGHRLFGVESAVVYGKGEKTLRLQVLPDAEPGEHRYAAGVMATKGPMAGPIIIVPPPPPPGGRPLRRPRRPAPRSRRR